MGQVHIGKKIKDVVNKSSYSVTEFAKKINRSRDVAYKIFAKENMDTGLLQKISRVLNHDFFNYYSKELPGMVQEEQEPYVKREDMMDYLANELKACKRQISDLEKKYELSEKVNKLMEEKLESLRKTRRKK